jgi:hypothetical protein
METGRSVKGKQKAQILPNRSQKQMLQHVENTKKKGPHLRAF